MVGEWSGIGDEVRVRVGVGNGTGVEVWKMFGEEEGGGDGLMLSNHPLPAPTASTEFTWASMPWGARRPESR